MTKRKAPLGAEPSRCDVCGRTLRYGNISGVCSGKGSTAACKRERTNRERVASGQLPHKRRENPVLPGELVSVRAKEVYNSWTVLEDGSGAVSRVLCRCKCNRERRVLITTLTRGVSRSCGQSCEARRAAHPYLPPGTYGNLEVLEPGVRAKDMVRVHCNRCGTDTTKQAALIKCGNTLSCGCGKGKFTHGLSRHPLYGTWNGMLDRCTNPKATSYEGYGEIGIRVCAGWQGAPEGLLNFIADMGERPPGMTLDRIDVDGGYWCGHCAECVAGGRPANCRWATDVQQARNKRSVNKVTRQRNDATRQCGDLAARLAEAERLLAARKKAPRVAPAGQDALF